MCQKWNIPYPFDIPETTQIEDGKLRVGYWTFLGWMIRNTIQQLPLEIRERIQDGEDISQIGLDPDMMRLIGDGSQKKGWTHLRSGI